MVVRALKAIPSLFSLVLESMIILGQLKFWMKTIKTLGLLIPNREWTRREEEDGNQGVQRFPPTKVEISHLPLLLYACFLYTRRQCDICNFGVPRDPAGKFDLQNHNLGHLCSWLSAYDLCIRTNAYPNWKPRAYAVILLCFLTSVLAVFHTWNLQTPNVLLPLLSLQIKSHSSRKEQVSCSWSSN